jgi:hypothetical protein
MLLELAKALSFLLSILSLYAAMFSAFFVPGARFEERLLLSLDKIAISACICFASGLLFSWPTAARPDAHTPLLSTIPVRLFFCALAAMIMLFFLSWYLAVYYVPWLRKNQPW